MIDLIVEIWQILRCNKVRTLLTGVAVSWGVFMLIVLVGMCHGLQNAVLKNAQGDRAQTITLWPGMTTKAWKGFKEGRYIDLKANDINTLGANGKGDIDQVIAKLNIDTATIMTAGEYIGGGLSGVYPRNDVFDRVEMVSGRYINGLDIQNRRKTMVLHRENAKILFGDEQAALGKNVRSLGLVWTIVGIYDNPWQKATYVPFTTVAALKGDNASADNIQVILNDPGTVDNAKRIEGDVRATMARAHDFDPEDTGALYTWNRFADFENSKSAMGILNAATWIIGFLTLLTGIVGVGNIMFVSVRERTHEIGIRRAIGAPPRSIMLQVLAESVAITAVFGYVGIAFGMGLVEILNLAFASSDMIKDPNVNLSLAAEVTLLLVVCGAVAGLLPARKATKVRPVEALRDE